MLDTYQRRRRYATSGGLRGALPGSALGAAFILVTLLSFGPLMDLDRVLNIPFHDRWPALGPAMAVAASTGERGVLLPPLFAFAAYLAWKRRTWTPVLVPVVPTLVLNLLVGVCKLATARGRPMAGDPDFFEQGILYPSGHAANVILYFGLAVFLARRYGRSDRVPQVLLALTWLACTLMVVACMYRQVHWFTDMVAGLLIGGAVLRSTVYDRGLVRRLSAFAEATARRVVARRNRSAPPTTTGTRASDTGGALPVSEPLHPDRSTLASEKVHPGARPGQYRAGAE